MFCLVCISIYTVYVCVDPFFCILFCLLVLYSKASLNSLNEKRSISQMFDFIIAWLCCSAALYEAHCTHVPPSLPSDPTQPQYPSPPHPVIQEKPSHGLRSESQVSECPPVHTQPAQPHQQPQSLSFPGPLLAPGPLESDMLLEVRRRDWSQD